MPPKSVEYIHHTMGISPAQGKKLLQGLSVEIKHKHLAGGAIPVALTKKQLEDMHAHHTLRKPYVLKFTKHQAAYHGEKDYGNPTPEIEGGSFWSKLWRGIKKAGKFVYRNVIKPVGKTALSVAANTLGQVPEVSAAVGAAKGVLNQIHPSLGSAAANAINNATNSNIAGTGVKRRGRPPKAKGGSFDVVRT